MSIEKLLEKDSPSLEMCVVSMLSCDDLLICFIRIKMQVDYDSTYHKEDTEVQKKLKARNKLIASHKMAIVEVEMQDSNDYEALTTLYRKIFRFLLEFAPNSKGADRTVEREIAAALESVFPRVGLKAFIQLTYEEKTAQLLELARIILGIRLFNREEGRGGSGIDNMDKDGNILAGVLSQDIDREVEFFKDACNKYQKAIIKAHNQKRKKIYDAEKEAEERKNFQDDPDHHDEPVKKEEAKYNIFQPMEVNDYMIDRWSKELSNRRQYLGFLRSLQDETRFLQEKISAICEKIRLELLNVKQLVTNKASVPKEVVYPRFDALGTLWLQLYEEVVVMIARSNTFQALCKYRLSFNPTLAESYYMDQEDGKEGGIMSADGKGAEGGGAAGAEAKDAKDGQSQGESLQVDGAEGGDVDLGSETFSSGAVLLSVENTPDFMLLPLELQGYCPWTIVEARGLLIPGKPSLGIVRYNNLYYVCDHAVAVRQFMKDPDRYIAAIKDRALRNPEYIHLLRLQRWFPNASIAKLLKMHEMESNNKSGQPLTKDASTGTPTHFIESYIDVNYHWNEWELRRRALKIVNLKDCLTTGMQTDQSHFRRDNETQVYEPREHGTQTKRDKGTNPPIVTTYAAGFRGKTIMPDQPERKHSISAAAGSKPSSRGGPKDEKGAQEDKPDAKDVPIKSKKLGYAQCGIVKLTLDL